MTPATSRLRADAGAAVSFGLTIVGMGVLVALTLLIVRANVPFVLLQFSANDRINRLFIYQAAVLIMTALVVALTAGLIPESFSRYFRVGRMAAPVGAVRALGIGGAETWKATGITFSVIISLVTAAIVVPVVATYLIRWENPNGSILPF